MRYRRRKLCLACDLTAARGQLLKKIVPERRLQKKTDPTSIKKTQAAAPPADEFRKNLALEAARLGAVVDEAIFHGIMAQGYHIISTLHEAGTLPNAATEEKTLDCNGAAHSYRRRK